MVLQGPSGPCSHLFALCTNGPRMMVRAVPETVFYGEHGMGVAAGFCGWNGTSAVALGSAEGILRFAQDDNLAG